MWQDLLQNWNGVSLFLNSEASSTPALQLYTDASGSYGGFLAGQWFQGYWIPHHNLSKKGVISIEWQELFSIYLACILWGPCWSGKRYCMWCDNKSVVSIINSKHSKSPRVMDVVRAITLHTLAYNFTFTATHIPGLNNSNSTFTFSDGPLPHPGSHSLSHSLHHLSVRDEPLRCSVKRYLSASLSPLTWCTHQTDVKHFLTFKLMHGL